MTAPTPAENVLAVELASLPREQVGPYLLLGLPKDATQEQIDAAWAKRVVWARKKLSQVPLEDIHWAREVLLQSPEQRLAFAVRGLNLDTQAGLLKQLTQPTSTASLDAASLFTEVSNEALAVPSLGLTSQETLAALDLPELPQEMPTVAGWLEEMSKPPLDPWKLPGLDEKPACQ